MSNFTYEEIAMALGWEADPTYDTLVDYSNYSARQSALAYAIGKDDDVKFWDKVIEVIEDELEARELVEQGAGTYHH